jgi:hypothetical protein
MLSESFNKVLGRNVFDSDTVVAVDAGKLNLKNITVSNLFSLLILTPDSQFQRLGAADECERVEDDEHLNYFKIGGYNLHPYLCIG